MTKFDVALGSSIRKHADRRALVEELGEASPENLLANLLAEIRRRLVVGSAEGAR